MRFTDRQLNQISGMTDKAFRAKYKVPKKLTKKERRKRNRARRKNERLAMEKLYAEAAMIKYMMDLSNIIYNKHG